MPSKGTRLLTAVTDDWLHFLTVGADGGIRMVHQLPVDQFLTEDGRYISLPEGSGRWENALLLVPDYWVGSRSWKFQSAAPSLITAFIERKLRIEFPDRPNILQFYEYRFAPEIENNDPLYAFYLQDPKGFLLFEKLLHQKLAPVRITTPAFLWQHHLLLRQPSFTKDQVGLAHLLDTACYLYFYSMGRFLFSRSIAIPDVESELPVRIRALSFEINQSLYLFSQKTKEDVEHLFLCAADPSLADDLAEVQQRPVEHLDPYEDGQLVLDEADENLGILETCTLDDLEPSAGFPGLSHRQQKKEREWKPVQWNGILIGLGLLLMLGAENWFLAAQSQSLAHRRKTIGTAISMESRQAIADYNEALEVLLAQHRRHSAIAPIIGVARSLPDNIRITETRVVTDPNPAVGLKGEVNATGTEHLKDSASLFLARLNRGFSRSRPLGLRDMDFEASADDKKRVETGSVTIGSPKSYTFTLRFELP